MAQNANEMHLQGSSKDQQPSATGQRDQRDQQKPAEFSRNLAPQHTKAPPALSAV